MNCISCGGVLTDPKANMCARCYYGIHHAVWPHRFPALAPPAEPAGRLDLPEMPEWAFRVPWKRFQFGGLLDGQLAADEREELGLTDAEPDRATDDFSYADRCTPNQERTLVMSTTPTGEGTSAGSNPAGVASQTPPDNTENAARTELRSVSTDENRPATRRPAPGDTVEIAIIGQNAGQWRQATVGYVNADGRFSCGLADFYPKDEGKAWRWPVTEAQAAAEAAPCTCPIPRDRCPACGIDCAACKAAPAVRRCTVTIGGADQLGGGADVECGAILGKGLHCRVCQGERCFPHCGGLAHFKGRTVSAGGCGSLEWHVIEIAHDQFAGEILRRVGERYEIVFTVSNGNRSPDTVVAELLRKVEQLEAQERPYQPPRVRPVGRIDDTTDQLLAATRGKLSDKKRAELLLEVIEWLRSCEQEWIELETRPGLQSMALIDEARLLHDRQVAGLFSRLAGAL